MKLSLLPLIIGILCLTSCDKDNDSILPNETVTKAFTEKFPTASQVKWEKKNTYMVADFVYDQYKTSAWFDNNGQWYMTETELRSLEALPEAVRTALKNSKYANWATDDIDCLERPDTEKVYVIEVKNGREEYDLYYSEDGILIKAIPDTDNDDYEDQLLPTQPLPSAITDFINTRYPGARIIETEIEHGLTEVDIIHGNRSKEVVFNNKQEWLNTHYDVRENEVEPTVMQTLAGSEYKDFYIDDIEKYETPAGDYYLFELEKGTQEVDIKIDLKGQITRI